MRKNKMMRIASALLVVVLLTTCAISGTFAKYVTDGYAEDFARVAKFGVTVVGTSDSMFKDEYYGLTYRDAVTDKDMTLTVESDVKVVAPGTEGTFTSFNVEGTPEVAVAVTYDDVVVEIGNNWIDKLDTTKFYCPIVITVNNVDICGLGFESADEFEAAVVAEIDKAEKEYAPNTNLKDVDTDLVISWRWDFDDADHTHCDNKQDDDKDTFLGDRAAADVANAGTISIEITCTVTQID